MSGFCVKKYPRRVYTWEKRLKIILSRLPDEFLYRASEGWQIGFNVCKEKICLWHETNMTDDKWLMVDYEWVYNVQGFDEEEAPDITIDYPTNRNFNDQPHKVNCAWGHRKPGWVGDSYHIRKRLKEVMVLSEGLLCQMPHFILKTLEPPLVLCYADIGPNVVRYRPPLWSKKTPYESLMERVFPTVHVQWRVMQSSNPSNRLFRLEQTCYAVLGTGHGYEPYYLHITKRLTCRRGRHGLVEIVTRQTR